MTKHQLEAQRIKTANRLNEIGGLEDLTDAIRQESESLEVEYRDSAASSSRRCWRSKTTSGRSPNAKRRSLARLRAPPKQRERLELRSKTGHR